MGLFGYTTEKEAAEEGFTHHGSYYGIPLWMTEPKHDLDAPMVETKFTWMEPLMDVAHFIEGFLSYVSGREHLFMFLLKKRIEDSDTKTMQ